MKVIFLCLSRLFLPLMAPAHQGLPSLDHDVQTSGVMVHSLHVRPAAPLSTDVNQKKMKTTHILNWVNSNF